MIGTDLHAEVNTIDRAVQALPHRSIRNVSFPFPPQV